jgi:hypothetical protein
MRKIWFFYPLPIAAYFPDLLFIMKAPEIPPKIAAVIIAAPPTPLASI